MTIGGVPCVVWCFVPPAFHLSQEAEKAEYDLHENSPTDVGYRQFLSRVFQPVNARLTGRCDGLDFGSGPGPTLSLMFEEVGHTMAIYDPFYAPDSSVLKQQYDFVTATEVVEHLRTPRADLERIWSCIKPQGVLGLMTKLTKDQAAFANWHYTHDRTHVSFYARETFIWLAETWQAEVEFVGNDVILLSKACDS